MILLLFDLCAGNANGHALIVQAGFIDFADGACRHNNPLAAVLFAVCFQRLHRRAFGCTGYRFGVGPFGVVQSIDRLYDRL